MQEEEKSLLRHLRITNVQDLVHQIPGLTGILTCGRLYARPLLMAHATASAQLDMFLVHGGLNSLTLCLLNMKLCFNCCLQSDTACDYRGLRAAHRQQQQSHLSFTLCPVLGSRGTPLHGLSAIAACLCMGTATAHLNHAHGQSRPTWTVKTVRCSSMHLTGRAHALAYQLPAERAARGAMQLLVMHGQAGRLVLELCLDVGRYKHSGVQVQRDSYELDDFRRDGMGFLGILPTVSTIGARHNLEVQLRQIAAWLLLPSLSVPLFPAAWNARQMLRF